MHLRSMQRSWMNTAVFAKGDDFGADTSGGDDTNVQVTGNNDDASDDGDQPVQHARQQAQDDAGGDDGDDRQDDQSQGRDAQRASQGRDGEQTQQGRDNRQQDQNSDDWRDKELTRRHRRIQEAQEEARLAREENARLMELVNRQTQQGGEDGDTNGGQPRQQPQRQFTEQDFHTAVAQQAAHMAFADQVGKAYNAGVAKYGESFKAGLQRLNEMGLNDDHIRRVMACDNPHEVMNDLAANPGEFIRIASLSPERQILEFAKKDTPRDTGQQQQRRPVSRTSPPVDPLNGRGGSSDIRYSDDVSDEEWHANEDKRERERWEQKRSRGF